MLCFLGVTKPDVVEQSQVKLFIVIVIAPMFHGMAFQSDNNSALYKRPISQYAKERLGIGPTIATCLRTQRTTALQNSEVARVLVHTTVKTW